jgi:uncharacterized membrane protein
MLLISVGGAGRGDVSDRFGVDALNAGDDTLERSDTKTVYAFAEIPALTIVGLEASQNFHPHNGRRTSIFIAHDPSFCYRALSSFKEAPVAFCPTCGTQIPDGAGCPKCAGGAVAAVPTGGGLADNVAGALAYVTIIPAIVFLVVEPFNKKRFVRFHAFQCLFFAVAWTVLWIGLSFIAHIPFLGWATVLIWPLVSLVGFVIWLILVLKAYQGQMFKLPVIGDMAEQQAGS